MQNFSKKVFYIKMLKYFSCVSKKVVLCNTGNMYKQNKCCLEMENVCYGRVESF